MTTTKAKAETPAAGSPSGKAAAGRTVHSAPEKCRAVLSLWAERRKPSEVCQELGVTWCQLNAWQDRAMEGMLAALEPRTRKDEEKGPALGEKLAQLLDRKSGQREGKFSRLQERLSRIQEEKKQKTETP